MFKKLSLLVLSASLCFLPVKATFTLEDESKSNHTFLPLLPKENVLWHLPHPEIMKKNIVKVGFSDFLEITNLHGKLGDSIRYDLSIDQAIETAFLIYFEHMKQGGLRGKPLNILQFVMDLRMLTLREAVLKDAKPVAKNKL